MLQQLSGKAWQDVTFKCKKLDIDDDRPPMFLSDAGHVRSDDTQVLSNSCEVTMVTWYHNEM